MTDETTPETTPPAPDGDAPGAERDDASLDSWFRPRSAEQKQDPAQATDEHSDSGASDASDASDASEEPEGSDNASESASDAEASDQADDEGRADRGDEGDRSAEAEAADEGEPAAEAGAGADGDSGADGDEGGQADDPKPAAPANDKTQVIPAAPPPPVSPAAAAPTQAIARSSLPKPQPAESDMSVRPAEPAAPASSGDSESWSPAPGPRPQYQAQSQAAQRQEPWQPPKYQEQPSPPSAEPYQQPYQQQTKPYQAPGGVSSILPPRGHADYDDFDSYSYADAERGRPPSRARRALLATGGVVVLVIAIAAALVFSGKVHVFGIGAQPVPTVGFSPSGTDAGSDATQTGTAFLTDWENGNLKAAANITDNQSDALAQLTAYKNDLKVSGLTLMPGSASAKGWMTFSVTAQVGTPSTAWSYSSGLATYSSSINGYTRWFVKWQPNLLFTSLKSGQKLTLGPIPPTADKVVDTGGTEITPANAPSLNGVITALKKAAPPAAGTPGQEVEVVNADGSVASKVAKVSDPVATGALKTTIDLKVQAAAQAAVNQAPNSSMVVLQPSTGNILAVANNLTNGLDNAMVGHYAPGSTFKTITTTLVLNKGVISNLNQTWDCPPTLNADGITLHNSEQESGIGSSFLQDFAQSCNNAFSRFEGSVSHTDLAGTAHDYYGFNQKWDVGLGVPTTYGFVPDASSDSLAEELVGQDQITASPLSMASVAATIANGSFKQPIFVPGTAQIPATPLSAKTDQNLKTLMHEVVVSGTLAGILPANGVYAKTGTAEVQGKTPNSWTIAFKGDVAVAALAVGGNFGAQTAGPEVKTLLSAVP